jgi:tRNA-specific adenosine deaminase 2
MADEASVHEHFMRAALAMATLALASDETPVGCVFVRDGAVVARAMNATNRSGNGTRHAEFVALASLCGGGGEGSGDDGSGSSAYDLSTVDLYVTVEPCVMCASLLRQLGIRRVFYGASNTRFGGTGGVLSVHSDGLPDGVAGQRPYPASGGWLRDEAIMLLRRFYVQENAKAPEPRTRRERKLKTEIEPPDARHIHSTAALTHAYIHPRQKHP